MTRGAVAVAAFVAAILAAVQLPYGQVSARVILVVVDGLRPDQVTPAVMPRLAALGARGTVFTQHHSIVPTVTRANAASIATGAYPETHGLLGNTVYSPGTFATKGVNTGSHDELEAMTQAETTLLTAQTLGAVLARAGKRLVVFSAGSSGSAFLLSHPLAANGAVVHPEIVRPAALEPQVSKAVGPGPREAVPNTARNRWIVDAYRTLGPTTLAADVTIFWFGDPDGTAHAKGLGVPETTGALRAVDAEIGRVEDDLRARGALDTTAILVTSDHGFSTHTGEFRLAALVAPFAQPLPDGSPDLVVTEGAINARRPLTADRLGKIVAALQARPEVGAIFTAPPGEGTIPGTLPLSAVRWQHSRSAPILVSGNWSAAANAAGVAGTTTQTGVAGHGTTSPFDIHNTLIAAGSAVRAGARSDVPTSNADLAPTLLSLIGVAPAPTMTGRVVRELRADGPAPSGLTVTRETLTSRSADGRYVVTAHVSVVDGHRYLDHTEVQRRP
jgi:arylsulfatase A-like enzyme